MIVPERDLDLVRAWTGKTRSIINLSMLTAQPAA